MKNIDLLMLLVILALFLGACSVSSDAADLYKKETPLQIEVVIPELIPKGESITLQAVLTQVEQKVENADFVHFRVWKQDGSIRYPMEEAEELGNGVYQMDFRFEKDGLYFLEVHAGNNGAISSPRQQFVVGELSKTEMEKLKEGPVKEEEPSEHHH